MALLAPLTGQEESWPEVFPLTDAEYFIGRLPGCAIQSTNDSVSRQHARLVYYQDQWYAEDLGSRNGTTIDGQPISTTLLEDNAIIQTGDHWFGFTSRNAEDFDAETFAAWILEMRKKAGGIAQSIEIPPTSPLPVPPAPPESAPKPPAAVLTNTMSLSASPVTRAYPPRQPHKSGKVSAILSLPGSGNTLGAEAASGAANPTAAAGGMVPSSTAATPATLKVTGPDYLWYAVIVLAAVGLILALVVFFVRRSHSEDSGSILQPGSIQHLVAQQGHGAVR